MQTVDEALLGLVTRAGQADVPQALIKLLKPVTVLTKILLFACFANGIKASETNTDVQDETGLRFIPRAVYPFDVPAEYTDTFITFWLATAGRAEAQFQLGAAYDTGTNVPVDEVRAAYWYWKAAEQGHTGAQINLGYSYLWDNGVFQDSTEAARLFRLAAEQGHTLAQRNLGVSYGIGMPERNIVQAYAWLTLAAAAQAEGDTAELRDDIADYMTDAQIAEAETLAQEYRAAYD